MTTGGHSTSDHPLVGGWRLRSWIGLDEDGRETRPMGDAPDGLLAYTAAGTMVGIMSRGDRPRFADDDATGGTTEEQARAFATFLAYGGRYRVEGDFLVHTVETSLFPNWVGTEQRRRWSLSEDGRTLTIVSPPLALAGVTRVQRLVWERVEA